MKKILTILAATATMFAFGAGQDPDPQPQVETVDHGADFEAFTAGDAFSAGLNDNAQQLSPYYWYTADTDAANIISNYVGETDATTPIGMRPDKFKQENNTKFLQVETTGKLYRTVKDNGGSADFTTSVTATYAHSLAEAPIYLDTLVKFTAADSVFGDDALENGDKIAIEYVEHESEGEGDPTVTNFVIRAGYVQANGEIVQTNYFADVPATFKKDDWHRLTVRAIGEVGGSGDNSAGVGFVVYLDEEPLVYSPSVEPGDATYTAKFNSIITENFYKSNLHAIYPSAVLPDTAAGQMISAAAFSGNGSLDDVVFTTTKPNFIDETSLVTITWDTNKITAVTLNNTALTSEEWENGSINIEPDQTGVVSFSVEYAPGCVPGESEVTSGTGSWDGHTAFTGLAPGAVCEIVAMMPFYQVGGKYFEDLESAIDAAQSGTSASPATFKLLANCAEMIKFTSGYVILDLAGYDIQGTDAQAFSVVCLGAHLTVTNSVPGSGAVKRPVESEDTAGAMQVKGDDGAVAVYVAKFDDIISVKPDSVEKTAIFAIYSGTFIDEDAGNDPDAFAYKVYVQDGATVTDIGNNYFQVGGAAQPIGTYQVTVTPNENATYAVTGAASNEGDVYTVATGHSITITATPKSGYEYAEAPTGWTLSEGVITIEVSAEGTVAIPGPTVQTLGTYTVTVIPTNNTTYAAAYKVGGSAITPDNDVLTVTVGQTIVITATPAANYEYATPPTGWTAGQDGEITIEVSEAGTVEIPGPTAKSGKTYPSYIPDDATEKGKYDTWKDAMTAAGVDVGDGEAYEDAYLLNCKPAEVTAEAAAFKFTSISYDTTQSKWITTTTTKNTKGADYNGTVTVTGYSDVGCTVGNETEAGPFFKASLQ